MRVAIYHMVINPKRRSCIDIEIDTLKLYAKRQGWEVYNIYLDETNIEEKKEELANLINDCSKGLFDLVLMKNAYYISRHTNKYLEIRKKLKENNILLHTLSEGDL